MGVSFKTKKSSLYFVPLYDLQQFMVNQIRVKNNIFSFSVELGKQLAKAIEPELEGPGKFVVN